MLTLRPFLSSCLQIHTGKLLLSTGLAYNSLSLWKLFHSCTVTLKKKGRTRAPSSCPRYWSDGHWAMSKSLILKAKFLLHFILCAFEATFLTWISGTFLVLLFKDHLDKSLDSPWITELKWEDSWVSGSQFWHCSKSASRAVTRSVPVSHSTITFLFTKSRGALWHAREATWRNQKPSAEVLEHHEWLGHLHSSVPLFHSTLLAQVRLQNK